MRLREAGGEDLDAACALLEAAFGRPDEARLLRALHEGDDLALTLLATGAPPERRAVGTETRGAAGRILAPSWGRDGTEAATPADGPSDEGEDAPVIGVAVLSRLSSPEGAVGLGPLAVAPEHGDRGVGKALIAECVERARAAGRSAIFVLGQPPYYTRFGFSVDAARPFRSDYPADYMMALELAPGALEGGGEIRYPAAFAGLG